MLFEVLVISLGIIFAFFAITGSMVWLDPRILGTSRLYWWLVKTKLQYDGRTLHPMHHGGGAETYKGEVNKQGQRHGKGKCVYPNGCVYEGGWKNGLSHGIGKCTSRAKLIRIHPKNTPQKYTTIQTFSIAGYF